MDYRDWGYDTRVPRERRPDDVVRPDDRSSTGEIARYRGDRRGGAHRADDDPELDPPRIGYATLSEFRSVYRGRRRREEAPADDRPYGRRGDARERWRDGENPDPRPEVNTAEWTREAYTGEWSREAYPEDWSRATDSTAERRPARDAWAEPRGRRAGDDDRAGPRSRERADDWTPPRALPPASGIPSSAIPTSSFPASAVPSSAVPDGYDRPSWAVGRGRTDRPRPGADDDSPPRGRRSWQDQIEPRWAADEAPVEPQWAADETQFETRWTAGEMDDETSVRLAGDDPRWVGIPSSAPRSPAVAYRDEDDDPRARVPSPRSAPPGDRGRFDRQRPAPSSYRSRPSLVEVAEDDLLQENELADGGRRGSVPAAIMATLAWFTVPVLLFAVYTFTIGSANRAQALDSLIGSGGRLAAALAFSVVVAVLIRWVSTSWRSVSVGLAAAVVGGGLSTVLLSAISGQPIG
ncbi:hypothetical protein WEI85_03640 [Actinomycetes bacterium KLBMP 9797]